MMVWVTATWLENEKLEDETFPASYHEEVNGKQFVRWPRKNAADAVARRKLQGPNWFKFEEVSIKSMIVSIYLNSRFYKFKSCVR